MDEKWGYDYFRKPPYIADINIDSYCCKEVQCVRLAALALGWLTDRTELVTIPYTRVSFLWHSLH